MATSTLTGRNPAPMMTNPQGELDQVAATHTTTSANRPRTVTTAQPLPPPQVSDPIHGSIDVGGVGVGTVGTGLGWHQPPPPQRSQGVQENSSERPGVRQPVHSREEDTPSPPRDGEIHSREGRDQRIPDALPFSALEQDHIRELTLTGQPERVPSGASDRAPSQSSAGGTEKVGSPCRTITPETIGTSTGAAGCRPEGSMDNRILLSSTDTLVPLPTGTVHLFKAEKIPARHRKLVLVHIQGETNINLYCSLLVVMMGW